MKEDESDCGCASCSLFDKLIEGDKHHHHEHLLNKHDETSGHEEIDLKDIGKKSFFTKQFWKLILISGTFLGFALMLEYMVSSLFLVQLMALLSVILSSHDVFAAAFGELKKRRLGASTLMVSAAIGSFFIFHGQEGAMAIFLYSVAEELEKLSADKARNAVSKLLDLSPDKCLVRRNGKINEVLTESVEVGEVVVVKPGQKFPLDGKIVKGTSYIDTHSITGESIPKLKSVGDKVFASSINGDSLIEIMVENESEDTLLARITRKIEEARKNKTSTERYIEKFSRYYTPIIFMIALLIMMMFPLILNYPIELSIYRGLTLLVISCPCALTLASPLSMVAALTKLAREGVLVKGGKYIENLKNIDIIAFDKTATITEGLLKIHDVVPFDNNISKNDMLELIASLEYNSDHPIAKAIVKGAKVFSLKEVDDFKVVKGKGIEGKINGDVYRAGSIKFFKELGIKIPSHQISSFSNAGKTPVLLARGAKFIGFVTVRDNLRLSSPLLIKELKNRNIKTMILSGDAQETVDSIADCLDIDVRHGGLLPDQKLDMIKKFQDAGHEIAMVGDGINDAPALSRADVGIAMGFSGTDIAIETADITIMNDDLAKIILLLDVEKKTNMIVKENIWVSIIVKLSFAVLTIFGFMTLAIAVGVGDMGLSLLVILNGFRIFRYRPKHHAIKEKDLKIEATRIVCPTCRTVRPYPQHHGREMVKVGDKLICWKSLIQGINDGKCDATVDLTCPTCEHIRIIQ
ncbi:MAG: heavy metal translocating P-type ATPase [Promethearchaeota archaeon]